MLDDEVRIRPATTEDAENLSDIAWQSKEYWDLDTGELNEFREILEISPELIENNIAYVAENIETEEILGFYFIEKLPTEYLLRYLCVAPDFMGTGIGEALFLSACEMAEEVGAKKLQIVCDKNSLEFYLNMGAKELGEFPLEIGGRTVYCLKLEMTLNLD